MSQPVRLGTTKKALSLDSGLGMGVVGKHQQQQQPSHQGAINAAPDRTLSVDSTRNKNLPGDNVEKLYSTCHIVPEPFTISEEMPAATLSLLDSGSNNNATTSCSTSFSNTSVVNLEESDDGIILDPSKVKMRTSLEMSPRDRRSKMLDIHPVIVTSGRDMIDGSAKAFFKMKYYGNVQLDRRITQPMLPWILADKLRRTRKDVQNIFLQVSSRGVLGISESKGSIVFEHFPQNITRFSRGHNKKCFAYLWRSESDSNFTCFVFETSDPDVVHQVAVNVRDASKEAMKYNYISEEEKAGVEAIENIRINNATMFEVLYCGRVTVSHKRAPPTLIDDTIEKFNVHEIETKKKKLAVTRKRHFSSGDQNGIISPSSDDASMATASVDTDRLSMEDTASSVSSDSITSSPLNPDADGDSGSIGSRSSQKDMTNVLLSPVTRDRVSSAGAGMLKHLDGGYGDTSSTASSTTSLTSAETKVLTSGHNRTMLFQIGKTMLTLISPDKKSFMLTKKFNDISFCSQGIKEPEFFGFICREKSTVSSYMCYVFKCQSEPVVDSIMTTLRQSFNVALQKSKLHVICGTCPMHQLHKLCQTLEGQSPEKAHNILLKQLETLSESERSSVVTKTKEAKATSAQEANEIIMSHLISICEQQQNAHTHNSDTEGGGGDSTSSSPLQDRKVLTKGASTESGEGKVGAFKKAKKSLATSFENLLSRNKKKNSIEEQTSFPNTGYRSRQGTQESINSESPHESSPHESPRESPVSMQKSTALPNPPVQIVTPTRPPNKYSMDDIPTPPNSQDRPHRPSPIMCKQDSLPEFMVSPMTRPRSKTLGDTPSPSPKTPPPESSFQYPQTAKTALQAVQKPTPMRKMPLSRTNSAFYDDRPHTLTLSPYSPYPGASTARRMSWRQQIFNRVVTPISESKHGQVTDINEEVEEDVFETEGLSSIRGLERQDSLPRPKRFSSRQQICDLWKKAIREQILLIRMDKENRNLQARQDAAHEKRIKLDYEEITPCLKEVTITWEKILSRPNRSNIRLSRDEMNDTFRQGIPKSRRGEIWQLICEQQKLSGCVVSAKIPEHEPYKELLKQLTIHQHAILIDLGRTFPTHPYFANPLGRGQLSLFNLLKAYSLLDTDVGYCQGLSFVAGVLLMHMDEEQSFEMLVYLMFSLGFRRQYKPDMIALQIQMYQLSRLLHDFHKRLYDHLEQNEIGPSLYAAPWFLTLFASQFPLGFVAKVFDLIFLQGFEVIFKVALIVLGSHEELLLHCDGFEAIIEFLKDTLPMLGIIQMENVINKAYQLDISKQLHAYEVEYHVLQEEMAPSPVHQRSRAVTDIQKLETGNRNLRRHNNELLEQLQAAHTSIHSQAAMIHNLRKNEDKHKSEIRSLNLERAALLNTVAKLRSLLPKDILLEDAGINFTSSILSESSFDEKDSSPDQKADSGTGNLSGSQTCSLDELDTEVASINKTKKKWGRNHSNGSSGSEISTSGSSEMDMPTDNLS